MKDDKNSALDKAISAMCDDTPSAEQIENSAARVRAGLEAAGAAPSPSPEQIRGCQDVRALLPAYSAGNLAAARALLVLDHLHECVACRNLAHAETPAVAPWSAPVATARQPWGWQRMALAATILIVIGLTALGLQQWFFASPEGMRARVQSVDGSLYAISDPGERMLKPGDEIGEGQIVRTAAGAHAFLQLRDGSVVEMNERAEFSVNMGRRDTTVQLDQGRVIVQAAKRRTGHLYVKTPDCKVSVTGTVFSVNSGLKGSRVAVIEGEVHVAHAGIDEVLHSGDVTATAADVSTVPVRNEIAWSRNLDKHLALLAQFATLQKKFEQIPTPGLRYSSALLTHAPANTIFYAAMPNLGDALTEANRIFQDQLQQSAVLREWWNSGRHNDGDITFEQMVQKVHDLSVYIGDEIAVLGLSGNRHDASVVVVAEVTRQGLGEFIQNEFARTSTKKDSDLLVVNDAQLASLPAQTKGQLIALVRSDFVLVSPSVASLREVTAQLNGGAFAGTEFGRRISDAYSRGAGFLLGVNLQQIMAEQVNKPRPASKHRHGDAVFARTGFNDARFLIAEHRDLSGTPDNRAVLDFVGQRRGIASWLAAPAPTGSLDFVSPNAGAVVSFVTKEPALMMDDLLLMVGASAKDRKGFAEAESKMGISFRDDLAACFGGDFTFALDGPILPKPSWKMIAEVYDAARLQNTIQRFVEAANREAAQHGRPGVQMSQETANGRTFYSVRSVNPKAFSAEVHYTFSDGYMIMAPSRALVSTALRTKQNGDTLARSDVFRSLLPKDDHTNVSAVMYQNLAPLIQPIASQLNAQQMQALQQIVADSKPTLICAYGEESQIELASASRLFPLNVNTMALSALLGSDKSGTSHRSKP